MPSQHAELMPIVLPAPALHTQELRALVESGAEPAAGVAVLLPEFDQELVSRFAPSTVIMFIGRSSREQPSVEALIQRQGVGAWARHLVAKSFNWACWSLGARLAAICASRIAFAKSPVCM
jgi:hypothetical protein